MRVLAAICAITVFSFAANAANGAIYMDTDWWLGTKLTAGQQGVSSAFDLVVGDGDVGDVPGFTPGTDNVGWAWVTITAHDDQLFDATETIQVDLGDVSGTQQHFQASFVLGVSSWPEVVAGTLFGDINADGVLAYSISAANGDFYLDSANLTVKTASGSVPVDAAIVPEATALVVWSLLGAIALTVGWRRKRRAQ
jgi:hypothetical protein